MFQVLQQESSPHYYLTVGSGKTTWGVHDTVDTIASKIGSASAGTACPASPSDSISKRKGRNSWQYYTNTDDVSTMPNGWHSGNIIVSCETANRCYWIWFDLQNCFQRLNCKNNCINSKLWLVNLLILSASAGTACPSHSVEWCSLKIVFATLFIHVRNMCATQSVCITSQS